MTIADVAADADARLIATFLSPWTVRPGGPPDSVHSGGHVWCEVRGATAAITPARAEAVAVRLIATVRSRTNVPERADQLDALDRFVTLATSWPACARHVLTVESMTIGGVETPAVVADLTVLATPC